MIAKHIILQFCTSVGKRVATEDLSIVIRYRKISAKSSTKLQTIYPLQSKIFFTETKIQFYISSVV